jgi:hypothetical protein
MNGDAMQGWETPEPKMTPDRGATICPECGMLGWHLKTCSIVNPKPVVKTGVLIPVACPACFRPRTEEMRFAVLYMINPENGDQVGAKFVICGECVNDLWHLHDANKPDADPDQEDDGTDAIVQKIIKGLAERLMYGD